MGEQEVQEEEWTAMVKLNYHLLNQPVSNPWQDLSLLTASIPSQIYFVYFCPTDRGWNFF